MSCGKEHLEDRVEPYPSVLGFLGPLPLPFTKIISLPHGAFCYSREPSISSRLIFTLSGLFALTRDKMK